MKHYFTALFVLVSVQIFAQDPFLTITSQDSIDDQPRLKSSLGVNMKLNGYLDLFGGLNDNETFNVGLINVFGTDDDKSLNADLYQTQIRWSTFIVTKNGKKIKAVVESDFWGGDGKFRLRKAYVETEHWQIGQMWNNFGDEDIWPDIMELEGPPSGVWLRSPHVKYMNTFGNPNWIYEASLEAPLDTNFIYAEYQPLLEEADQFMPDITFAVKYKRDWGHLRLSSILRSIRYKIDDDLDKFLGYGVSFSGNYQPKLNNLQFQLVGGKGISAYLTTVSGGGFDGYPVGVNDVKATPAFGGWISYSYYITKKLHPNVVFGATRFQLDNSERLLIHEALEDATVFVEGDFIHKHYYGIFNVMYDAYERMTIGLELDYGIKTIEVDGSVNDINRSIDKSRDAMRISFGFMYNF
ncbi:hypothetical protein [Formosa sp. S-31]|uniref:hypothetical protein n=1 Tax=Formosa sp. S-31 TaxID=2790949 RepID=UPI003EBBB2DD